MSDKISEIRSPRGVTEAFSALALPETGHYRDLSRLLNQREKEQYIERLPKAIEREKRLKAEYSKRIKPPGWQTTDPRHHDPDNFRYIVHTIVNTDDNDYIPSLKGSPEKSHQTRKWMSLEGFLAREMISATLVDEIHRGTYYQREAIFHGFVFKVPEPNIVAIAPGDMLKPWGQSQHGALIYTREEIEQNQYMKAGIELRRNTPSARDFLNGGVNPNYNELVIDGVGPTGEQISIKSMFLIVDPVLGIPLYELYSRVSKSPRELYSRVVAPVFTPKLGDEIRWDVRRMRRRYQEARDLAQLLGVPQTPLPARL